MNDISTLQDRVAYVLNHIEGTHEDLAENLGVNRNTITSYKKGQGNLKGVVLENLVLKYDINPIWLLTGRGEYHIVGELQDPETTNEFVKASIERDSSKNEKYLIHSPLNSKILRSAIKHIEEWGEETKVKISVDLKSELVSILYELALSGEDVKSKKTYDRFMNVIKKEI